MRITYTYHGKENFRDIDRKEIMVGRLSPLSAPDIDLGEDPTVSRKHCRIKVTGATIAIEDLRSTNGTVVDGEPVEQAVLQPDSEIRLGETILRLTDANAAEAAEPPAAAPAPTPIPKASAVAAPKAVLPGKPVPPGPTPKPVTPAGNVTPPARAVSPPAPARPQPTPVTAKAAEVVPPAAPSQPAAPAPAAGKPVAPAPTPAPKPAAPAPAEKPEIPAPAKDSAPAVPASAPAPVPAPVPAAPAAEKPATVPAPESSRFRDNIASLFEVPLSFTPEMKIEEMLTRVLERVLKLIPGARHGAILLTDHAKDKLVVRASHPAGEVVVSESLARRVMEEGHGFILQRNVEGGTSLNPKLVKVETGMYAPLLIKEKALGAIYLDDPDRGTPYSEADMQFLLAAAHYVAMVAHNQELQAGLARNSTMLNRVSAKFSPAVQDHILQALSNDQLKPGGKKDDLPVLVADLHGFQTAGNDLPVDTATEMMGEYFAAIQKAIFRCDGTIDRFAGDNIVAVFGAPVEDEQRNEKAVIAAIAMRDAIKELNVKRVQKGGNIWHLGVGVSLGSVFHGFVGTPEHMEFTVAGPGVFRAKGFCKGAQNGEVLIGPELYQKVFKIIEADRSTVEHKEFGEFHCYRVKSMKQH